MQTKKKKIKGLKDGALLHFPLTVFDPCDVQHLFDQTFTFPKLTWEIHTLYVVHRFLLLFLVALPKLKSNKYHFLKVLPFTDQCEVR